METMENKDHRIYVDPGKELGDRLVLYSEKLSIFCRYLEALQDALPPQEPAMFWFRPQGLSIVVNVPTDFRYHKLHFDKSFFTAYRCIPSGFRVILNLPGLLNALGRLDKATKSRCFTLMDAKDNTLVLSGCNDRAASIKHSVDNHDVIIQQLIERQQRVQSHISIVPKDQFAGPAQFAYACEQPKVLQRYPIVILVRPDWLHAVLKRMDRSSDVILEFDRFRQTFALRCAVDGKTCREITPIADERILPNPFFKSSMESQQRHKSFTIVRGNNNETPTQTTHHLPLNESIPEPQTTPEWIDYYKSMSCNIQCSAKSIWVAVKKLTRCSPFVRIYMANQKPLVLEHVLDANDCNKSSYATWIHPIHETLQTDLIPSQAEMETIVEAMLAKRAAVPEQSIATKLAVEAIHDHQKVKEIELQKQKQTNEMNEMKEMKEMKERKQKRDVQCEDDSKHTTAKPKSKSKTKTLPKKRKLDTLHSNRLHENELKESKESKESKDSKEQETGPPKRKRGRPAKPKPTTLPVLL